MRKRISEVGCWIAPRCRVDPGGLRYSVVMMNVVFDDLRLWRKFLKINQASYHSRIGSTFCLTSVAGFFSTEFKLPHLFGTRPPPTYLDGRERRTDVAVRTRISSFSGENAEAVNRWYEQGSIGRVVFETKREVSTVSTIDVYSSVVSEFRDWSIVDFNRQLEQITFHMLSLMPQF